MDDIVFESTNGRAPEVSLREALLRGQAPDGGLYTPQEIPKITLEEIEAFRGKTYAEIALEVCSKFIGDCVPQDELKRIVDESYNFDTPLEQVYDRNYLMRLDRGPTAAFKDYAARMLARLMRYFLKQENKRVVILTATSGDTGSAVANAFHHVENIDVMVLFPEKEVTERQRRQMTTLGGNITPVAVDGKFDDCQHLAKTAFSDESLSINLSSANSINFGRLMPQSVYYFYAYSRLYEKLGEKIVFSVPSGNFGNLVAAVLAFKMGLPVEKFVVATNENNEFPKFLETGKYNPISPSRECISNAMNVGNPSNLARLIHLYGGFLNNTAVLEKQPDMQAMRKDYYSVSVTDEETRDAIKSAYDKHDKLLEPHGAVGWYGLEKYLKESGWNGLSVSLETADPAKFPEEINKVLGFDPPLPPSLQGLDDKNEDYLKLENNYDQLKKLLNEKYAL